MEGIKCQIYIQLDLDIMEHKENKELLGMSLLIEMKKFMNS